MNVVGCRVAKLPLVKPCVSIPFTETPYGPGEPNRSQMALKNPPKPHSEYSTDTNPVRNSAGKDDRFIQRALLHEAPPFPPPTFS